MADETCEVVIVGEVNEETDTIQWQMFSGLPLANDQQTVVFFFALRVPLPEGFQATNERKLISN